MGAGGVNCCRVAQFRSKMERLGIQNQKEKFQVAHSHFADALTEPQFAPRVDVSITPRPAGLLFMGVLIGMGEWERGGGRGRGRSVSSVSSHD